MNKERTNIFDGDCLKIKLNKKLFFKIRSITQTKNLYLYDENKQGILINNLINDMIVYLPIGIYSYPNMKLYCLWNKTNRKFCHKSSNIEKYKTINNLKLNEFQEYIIKKIIEEIKLIHNRHIPPYITLNLPCAFGKTIISMFLIKELKYKSFIIVSRLALVKQWVDTFKKFMPDINVVGSFKGVDYFLKKINQDNDNKENIESDEEEINNLKIYKDYIKDYERKIINKDDIDILIFPDKHLNNKTFIQYIKNNYTIGFIDEIHTYNLFNDTSLSRFLTFYSFPYFFSLTATNKIEHKLFFGSTINLPQNIIQELNTKKGLKKILYIVDSEFDLIKNKDERIDEKFKRLEQLKISKKKNITNLFEINNLYKKIISLDQNRINIIRKNIIDTYNKSEDSRIVVLTYFREEMISYYNYIKNILPNVYIGDSIGKLEESFENVIKKIKSLKKFIFITTCHMSGTGLDIKSLNILHLTFVLKNENFINQYCGRIERDFEIKQRLLYIYNMTSYDKLKTYIKENNNIILNLCKTNDWCIKHIVQ